MVKNKKKAIIFISCIIVFLVVIGTVVLSVAFTEGKSIVLLDSNGVSFGTITWDGTAVEYTVNNNYEREYAVYVTEETKNILIENTIATEANVYEYMFGNVTEIHTNYVPNIQAALKKAYDNNIELKSASCAMAVTDLKGRLVGVFSSSAEDNLSMQKTYAGSTLKPLSVYAPAIDSGEFTWSSLFIDEPVKQVQDADGSYSDWPTNSDGKYTHKDITLANALTFSTNTVAVRLLQEFGVKQSLSILDKSYGMNVDYEKNLAEKSGEDEVLGNVGLGYLYSGVSVVDMAGYYQVFANGGRYVAPASVDEIIGTNGSIYEREYKSESVMQFETASIMNEMLQKVVEVGTGVGAKLENVSVGGKTGTTTDNADNWFVGFTPEYSCAVWHSTVEKGNICSEVFSSVFENVECAVEDFKYKGNIETKIYCEKSGLLRGDKCIYCNKGYYFTTEDLAKCNECS